MATARKAINSYLKIGDAASPEVFTTVGKVGDIDGPTLDSEEIEITSHDTTSGFKEFVLGTSDPGNISFPCYFDANDTQHQGLLAKYIAKSEHNWRIDCAGSSPAKYFAFAGRIKAFSMGFPVNGVITAQVTIRITGSVSLT